MPTRDELVKAFKAFDTDKSGTLSADELVSILTRASGGAPMPKAEAEALIKTVDINGDGVLDLEEFCTLMAAPGSLTMLPAPSEDEAERYRAFESETKTVKKSSPVKAVFERLAKRDLSLIALELKMGENDNSLNMEFCMWPDTRKAAALALLCGNGVITSINLSGCNLNDMEARALAAALALPSCHVEVLNLERNGFTEGGLLALIASLKDNSVLRELKLADQKTPITTAVEVAFAELLDSGGAPSLVKLGPPMRNPNEKRRVDAAISRNLDAQRKRRAAAAAAK